MTPEKFVVELVESITLISYLFFGEGGGGVWEKVMKWGGGGGRRV